MVRLIALPENTIEDVCSWADFVAANVEAFGEEEMARIRSALMDQVDVGILGGGAGGEFLIEGLCTARLGAERCDQPRDADCHTNPTFRHLFVWTP